MVEPTPPDLSFLRRQLAAARQDREGLKGHSHAPTTPSMDTVGERELVDQKIAAAEARTDIKFARLEGKLDLVLAATQASQKQSSDTQSEIKNTKLVFVTTAVATVIALGGLILALFSFGATEFANGTSLRDLVAHIAHVRPISPSR